MIVKQMDVRSNMKKYLDMAYEGEIVIIPRKHDRNVVIISEEEYSRLSRASRLTAYAGSVSKHFKDGPAVDADNVRTLNHDKLETIRSMGENWNGNGAPAFPSSLIDKIHSLIDELYIQPEIFPTALCTIQLEYDNARRDHLEIEIGKSAIAEIFIVYYDGSEAYENIPIRPDSINERVGAFYG